MLSVKSFFCNNDKIIASSVQKRWIFRELNFFQLRLTIFLAEFKSFVFHCEKIVGRMLKIRSVENKFYFVSKEFKKREDLISRKCTKNSQNNEPTFIFVIVFHFIQISRSWKWTNVTWRDFDYTKKKTEKQKIRKNQ